MALTASPTLERPSGNSPLKAPMASLLNLNDDILTMIVSTLAIRDQVPLRVACRRMLRVCDGDRLWSVLCSAGAIAPAHPLTWKGLGQRLACHRWCYGTESNASLEATSTPLITAPMGRWLKVVQSGTRYSTCGATVLPYIDLVAASKPLTHHKGNNTASIGLIPIGLVPSSRTQCSTLREGGDDNNDDTEASFDESNDSAVALHKKLLAAMGVEYTGDWQALCEVMRPACGAAPRGNSTTDPTAPSLHVFDTMPHSGTRRVMAICLSPGDVEQHPNATAKLTETLFTTCSTVVFAAPDGATLAHWLSIVSPHMSFVASPSPFSTPDNTPNVVFMTHMPIPSLRDVLAPSPSDDCIAGESSQSETHNPHKEIFSWVLNRSSCVGEVVFDDATCPLSIKTFYAPAWVAPECSLPLPAPAIARMLIAAGEADGGERATLWTREVAQSVCEGHSRQCISFYEEAMRTEIGDANRPLIAFTHLPVPMDPAEMVSIQDHFFYASLRSFAMVVRHVCGSNTELGMTLLEEFKKDISTSFRRLWAENIQTSRAYCTQLFDNIFYPLHDKYNGNTSIGTEMSNDTASNVAGGSTAAVATTPASFITRDPFTDRRALHQWFSNVTDKISEYIIKAKGPRKMDVLAERITTRTIGGLKNFCMQHPDHPYIRIEDVSLAGSEIGEYCQKQLANYHSEQDDVLSVKQRNSAMYTACLGTMWAYESVGEAVKYLAMVGPEYDTWGELLQLKREGLGLAPTAILSLRVANPQKHLRHENWDRESVASESGSNATAMSETNSVSASSERHGTNSRGASRRSRESSFFSGEPTVLGGDQHVTASPTTSAPPAPQQSTMRSMLSSLLSIGNNASQNRQSVQPPPPPPVKNTMISSSSSASRLSVLRRAGSVLRSRQAQGECVLFSELEVERQGYLQALMHKQSELKLRMETIGKQFNLRSDQTSDFNVIQRQFSHGFKDYRAARRVEDAADEIASKLRVMRERVRNSFSSTRER